MKRKLIGRVGVDSGQLLIIDPCYIEDEWKKDSESEILGVKFWGAGKANAVKYLQAKGYNVEIEEDGAGLIRTNNQKQVEVIQQALVEFLEADFDKNRIVWNIANNGSYQEVCQLTMNEKSSGEFKNIIGCAFTSGFGDGLYEVYATYKDFSFGNMVDERITKVEIILIED
ncbi:hypothetical protein ABET51_13800 [Metabacillus fastidiosus]|uniref:hypothetical protein n=1 Tax=Metabacillus fastidiosus TaxID=1458 RepID=UPI003D2A6F34